MSEVNAQIEYIIKNNEETILISENESIIIEKQISLIRIFEIAKNAKIGDYILYVRVSRSERVASDSAFFKVVPVVLYPFFKRILKLENIIIFILLVVIIIIIIYQIKRLKQKPYKKNQIKKLIKKRKKEKT